VSPRLARGALSYYTGTSVTPRLDFEGAALFVFQKSCDLDLRTQLCLQHENGNIAQEGIGAAQVADRAPGSHAGLPGRRLVEGDKSVDPGEEATKRPKYDDE
jgi:hypothetical protein